MLNQTSASTHPYLQEHLIPLLITYILLHPFFPQSLSIGGASQPASPNPNPFPIHPYASPIGVASKKSSSHLQLQKKQREIAKRTDGFVYASCVRVCAGNYAFDANSEMARTVQVVERGREMGYQEKQTRNVTRQSVQQYRILQILCRSRASSYNTSLKLGR